MRFIFCAVLAALIAGCSTSSVPSTPPGATNSGADLAFPKTSCVAAHQKAKYGGGLWNLPKCYGFSGVLRYPKYYGTAGTITADVYLGTKELEVGRLPVKPAGKIKLYIAVKLKSTSASDTRVYFYHGTLSGNDGGKIFGPFSATKPYWEDFVITSGSGAGCNISFGMTVEKGEVLGVAFPNGYVNVGDRQFLVISSESCNGS